MTVTRNLSDLPSELGNLLEQNFTGEIAFAQREDRVTVYLSEGELIWVEAKVHPLRRWQRAIEKFCVDQKNEMNLLLEPGIGGYRQLSQAVARQVIRLNQGQAVIAEIAKECFLELLSQQHLFGELTWKIAKSDDIRPSANLTLSAKQTKAILSEANLLGQQWQESNLGEHLPTVSPRLEQEQKYDAFEMPIPKSYLQGNYTFWDIAAKMQTSVILIAKCLIHLERQKVVKLQQIPDFFGMSEKPSHHQTTPLPLASSNGNNSPTPLSSQPQSNDYEPASTLPVANSSSSKIDQDKTRDNVGYTYDRRKPLIACIDDSPVLAHSVKKILASVGYQSLIISEPLIGMGLLVKHRPNLILLDLLMPTVTGYSVCKFLRETNLFKTTPIIILTAKDTIIDRTRAKMAGATDFITKPPEPQELLHVVRLHITDVPWS
ncbi:MAG TPA: response regulator [Xenococcaceae cyanobacterium]